MNISKIDLAFWALIIYGISALHALCWSIIEKETSLSNDADLEDKELKAFDIGLIYGFAAFIWGMLILFGVYHIDICLNTTFNSNKTYEKYIQIVFIVAGVLFFQIITIKISRWLLGMIRGHDTLIDNFLIYKRRVKELVKVEKSDGTVNDILPQNERNVNMLGEFIAHRRQELGLSQSKLARLSGHPVSSIHGIENGDNLNPRFEIIIDLCQVLDVSLDDMKTAFLENGKATETKK